MSNPSFVLIPLILFEYWATLKFLYDNNDDNLAITTAQLFLRNRQDYNIISHGEMLTDFCDIWIFSETSGLTISGTTQDAPEHNYGRSVYVS